MKLLDVLTLIGGLSLFLFGMNVMSDALERRAGNSLKSLLGKLTKNKAIAFITGLAVTAIIQSSSATTVMVVGFVNSGLMTLGQSIGVIMGANIGTTVTAWVLSLGGVSGDNIIVQLFKPTTFTPILALIGIVMVTFFKSSKSKDTGFILLGFATLMFGMDTMSGAVEGLSEVEAFRNLFLIFKNPIFGVLAGIIVTAIIQSSSASVGILQALTVTGQVSYGAAVPIIMGQNIGTCVTTLISSVGANRNAKRTAVVHLSFNIIGTTVWLAVFYLISKIFEPAILNESASFFGIAVVHSLFNVLCTILLLPFSALLEKIAMLLVPESNKSEKLVELDERLLSTPSIALDRCNSLVCNMANESYNSFSLSKNILVEYNSKDAEKIKEIESLTDHYEDIIGSYLIKLSLNRVSDTDNVEISKMLKVIGDFERIADHTVNVLESSEELRDKKIQFSKNAIEEIEVMCSATQEILDLSKTAFINNDITTAYKIEPLEQVIDEMRERLRNQHILRLKDGACTVEAGFIWVDLLTNLERIADHCSNIAACIIDSKKNNMNLHQSVNEMKNEEDFKILYKEYSEKYKLR